MLFTLFVMKVYIIIIMICRALADYMSENDSPNVGSVLFTQDDLQKQRWSTEKIKLLQARRYFQRLIPAWRHIRTVNEVYLDNLLNYYDDSYNLLKRESNDTHVQNLMNLALWDALGGYLKIWVLPITKYAYYGGTVSMEKAIYAFNVYENIKRSLNTDGRSWRIPNESLLRTVAIDVISLPRVTFTRSMGDPCDPLAFYEKTSKGLKVPMPLINWDMKPVYMVLPLKNNSLILLTSPNSTDALLNYYANAENCMKSQDLEDYKDFNKRFQKWLLSNVAPHLNDDNLYVAFGSILSVMNITKRFCDKILCSTCNEKLQINEISLESSWYLSHKKYIIVAIIVFIEVVWCIPSLFYIMRQRKNKRKGFKGFSFKFFKQRPTFNIQSYLFKRNPKDDDSNKPGKGRGVKLLLKPRKKTTSLEVDVQYPSYDSKFTSPKSSKSQQKVSDCTVEITKLKEVPRKSALKKGICKVLPEFESTCISGINKCPTINFSSISTQIKTCNSDKTQNTSLVSTVIPDEETIKDINYVQESALAKLESESKPTCEYCISTKNGQQKSKMQCSCTCCLEDEINKHSTAFVTTTEPTTKFLKTKHDGKESKKIERSKIKDKQHTEKKSNKTKRIKVTRELDRNHKEESDKPMLQIRIERPDTEIRVGITNIRTGAFSKERKKPSKIPRLVAKASKPSVQNEECIQLFPKIERTIMDSIPVKALQAKKRAVDDSVIRKRSSDDKKLNVTL